MLYKYYLEIKNRIFLLILVWFSTVLIVYTYKEVMLFLFLKPSEVLFKEKFLYFIFTNLTEVFSTYIKFSYFIGNQILFVYLVYMIFIFLAPGLYLNEYKNCLVVLSCCFILWCFSIVCLNKVLLPVSLNFFYSYHETKVNQAFSFHYEAKINEYFNLYLSIYYMWCLNSQLFIILYFVLEFFKNNLKYLKELRKVFYLFFLILATVISPPDVLSQIILAIFLISFYEIVIVVIILKKQFLNFN